MCITPKQSLKKAIYKTICKKAPWRSNWDLSSHPQEVKKRKKKVELSEKKIKMADLSPNVLIIIINSNGLNTLSINQS